MKRSVIILQMLARVSGLIQIILGVLFWTGNALGLIPVHIFFGSVLVLSLWTLAVMAARSGAHPGQVALAGVWGLILPIIGLTQARILVGPEHWIIQAIHLLLGLGAMGQAEGLARRIKQARPMILQK